MNIYKKPSKPKNYKDHKQLLKYVIRMLIYLEKQDGHYTHNQFASMLFGKADEVNQVYLNRVVNHYKRYIEYAEDSKSMFRFDVERILADHPDILEDNKKQRNLNIALSRPVGRASAPQKIKEMIEAIDDEIVAAKEDLRNNTYFIKGHRQLKYGGMKGVFDLVLDIEDDQLVKVYEGLPAFLKVGKTTMLELDILSFDQKKNILTVDTIHEGVGQILRDYNCQVVIDTIWLLGRLKGCLEELELTGKKPIDRLLAENYTPKVVENGNSLHLNPTLYKNQKAAIEHAHKHDISLIWGPPGTGKTFTLSHYLLNSLMKGEKTIVCCIANVAVDNIVRALIETIESEKVNVGYKKGQVIRVGKTRDPELVNLDYLFPTSQQIDDLRKRIKKKSRELSKAKTADKKNIIRSQRNQLIKDLSDRMQARIQKANIIFSTAAKFHVDSSLNLTEYDNLVIDEASMMSVPHFIPMAAQANKRIINVGDFRQLGPVVLSRSKMADKWLHSDLFKFAGLDYDNGLNHPGLTQLDMQRRFHPQICGLINQPFYAGKLKTDKNPKQTLLVPHDPFKNEVVAYQNISNEPAFVCKSSSTGSRFNEGSAEYVVDQLLASLLKHPQLSKMDSIGVITPYRAQVNLLNRLIEKKGWSKSFTDKINVGTIHAFQGSQADLLILDLVESKERQVGILYRHKTGSRLMNVAVSRARSKLIVVGDIEAILYGRGNINIRKEVRKLFQKLKSCQHLPALAKAI